MNTQIIYQVDAFAATLFGGNPAAVCPLIQWLSDEQMQLIARENNLSETAFIVEDNGIYHIRWFTPNTEVALCGHATLASAYIIFEKLNHSGNEIIFTSQSGELRVTKNNDMLQMNFPALPFSSITLQPDFIKALNTQPIEVYESTFDLLVIVESEKQLFDAQPDLNWIAKQKYRGVILTTQIRPSQIHSRCFYPACDVPEDPVTGSAHCVIIPYWCDKLQTNTIKATQGSSRQGQLICETRGDRVLLSGQCQLYMQGELYYS